MSCELFKCYVSRSPLHMDQPHVSLEGRQAPLPVAAFCSGAVGFAGPAQGRPGQGH